jgi:hypothetical protein
MKLESLEMHERAFDSDGGKLRCAKEKRASLTRESADTPNQGWPEEGIFYIPIVTGQRQRDARKEPKVTCDPREV